MKAERIAELRSAWPRGGGMWECLDEIERLQTIMHEVAAEPLCASCNEARIDAAELAAIYVPTTPLPLSPANRAVAEEMAREILAEPEQPEPERCNATCWMVTRENITGESLQCELPAPHLMPWHRLLGRHFAWQDGDNEKCRPHVPAREEPTQQDLEIAAGRTENDRLHREVERLTKERDEIQVRLQDEVEKLRTELAASYQTATSDMLAMFAKHKEMKTQDERQIEQLRDALKELAQMSGQDRAGCRYAPGCRSCEMHDARIAHLLEVNGVTP